MRGSGQGNFIKISECSQHIQLIILIRFSYNSYTRIISVLITEVHDTQQDWVDEEKKKMIFAQFLNQDEALLLKLRVGTSRLMPL